MPEYAVSVELRPPDWYPDLDELQLAGVEHLLDGALQRVFGAATTRGTSVDRLRHRVDAHVRGARLFLTVEASNIQDAEGATEAMLHEALRSCDPLRRWTIEQCEVSLDEEAFKRHMDGPAD